MQPASFAAAPIDLVCPEVHNSLGFMLLFSMPTFFVSNCASCVQMQFMIRIFRFLLCHNLAPQLQITVHNLSLIPLSQSWLPTASDYKWKKPKRSRLATLKAHPLSHTPTPRIVSTSIAVLPNPETSVMNKLSPSASAADAAGDSSQGSGTIRSMNSAHQDAEVLRGLRTEVPAEAHVADPARPETMTSMDTTTLSGLPEESTTSLDLSPATPSGMNASKFAAIEPAPYLNPSDDVRFAALEIVIALDAAPAYNHHVCADNIGSAGETLKCKMRKCLMKFVPYVRKL